MSQPEQADGGQRAQLAGAGDAPGAANRSGGQLAPIQLM
jgi:hypothetical protein